MMVLDTTFLIDLVRKEESALQAVRTWHAEGETLATTSINVAELLRGETTPARRFGIARRILAGLHEVPFGPRAAVRFARLMAALDRAGRPIGAVDGMIAAVALEEGAMLVTENSRELRRVDGLRVVEHRP